MKINLLKESKDLADFLISACTSREGLLAKKIDLRTDKPSGSNAIHDLGDYAPFFFWLGKRTKNRDYQLFSLGQTDTAARLFKSFRFFSANDLADVVLGFVLMYQLAGNQSYKAAADLFYKNLFKRFLSRDFLAAYSFSGLKSPFALSGYTGVYIEELCRLCRLSGDKSYLTKAEKLAASWLEDSLFRKTGLFFMHREKFFPLSKPFFVFTNISPDVAVMMKPNTNMLFGLLELYKLTKNSKISEAIAYWLTAVKGKMIKNNYFCLYYNLMKNQSNSISLETNHAVMDVLIEIYRTFQKKEALDLAIKTAGNWISLQNQGLVRNSPEEATEFIAFRYGLPYRTFIPGRYSRLDSQTDFSIILLKLYDITKKRVYYNAAEELITAMIRLHKFRKGYVEFVDTGDNNKIGYVIDCKYLALLLKAFLTFYLVSKGKGIFTNNLFTDIIRDR